ASSAAQARAYVSPSLRPGRPADTQASAPHPIALAPAAPSKASPVAPPSTPRSAAPAASRSPPTPAAPRTNPSADVAAAAPGDGPATASSEAAGGAARFVVQIGAFADDAKMRDARGKVERLGLKTYTQSVDTPGGKRVRVRVGPFTTKAEADRAAAKIKAGSLPAAVLVL
ncbi:MAG: SPOR domain-containing protein, partial [Burkholderiaceae bacterium]